MQLSRQKTWNSSALESVKLPMASRIIPQLPRKPLQLHMNWLHRPEN